jgi:hypothetical protein
VFVPWDILAPLILEGSEYLEESKKYTNYSKWHARVLEFAPARKAMELREQAVAEEQAPK